MSATVKVYEGVNSLTTHGKQWNQLLAQSGNPSFFLTIPWLQCWAKHWLGHRNFLLVVAERDGKWIGGLPLTLGQGKIGARWKVRKLEFAGAPYFDRMELPAANAQDCNEALEAILSWANHELKGWTALGFNEVPNGSNTLNAFKSIAAQQGFGLHTVLTSKAPMVDLKTKGKTSSKYRRQLRQSMEKLCERGEVCSDFFTVKEDQIDSLVKECSDVEATSWKGDDGVGIFRDQAHQKFVADLWKSLAANDGIALATIRLDGELIIYHWGFRHQGRFLSYNMAQRPETNNVRGGSLILRLMVEEGEALNFDAIDASRGSLTSPNVIGRYHGPIRDHGNIVVYSNTAKGSLLSLFRHSILPVWRQLRKKPGPPQLEDKTELTDSPCINESA